MSILTTAGARCTVCGQPPSGAVSVSLQREYTCARHPIAGRCVFCTRPHAEAAPAGWAEFGGGRLRCPTCGRDAVEDQRQARAHLPGLREDMAGLGIELNPRVRLRVVDPAEMSGYHVSGGVLLALTDEIREAAGGRLIQNEIRVARGLPEVLFGRAVVHEMVHVWLAQQGCELEEKALEEGLCELFAYAWLKRRPARFTDALREQMKINPDPVYGEGFRGVRAAVNRLTLPTVVEGVLRTGRLPTP